MASADVTSKDRPTGNAAAGGDAAAEIRAAGPAAPGLGRVPFALRIGVTGHRSLADPDAVAGAVREALRLVRGRLAVRPGTQTVLVAVSALAEGADRVVAEQVLAEPGSRLEVVLPRGRNAYARDFATAASRREFHDLLRRASAVWQAPSLDSDQDGYKWAGRQVADRCDVLVAVWDGEHERGRGGTAEIVRYAREQQVPLVWICPGGSGGGGGGPVLHAELETEAFGLLRKSAKDLSTFNAGRLSGPAFQARLARELGDLGLGKDRGPGDGAGAAMPEEFRSYCDDVAAWLLPFFIRADTLAVRLQGWFRALSTAVFAMAAAAVAVVAVQVNFWPGANWVAIFEVLLLLMLLAIPASRNWLQLHERWTSYRFLAERLRSAYFLALAGTTDRAGRGGQSSFADPSVGWIERALAEIVARRPPQRPAATEVEPLREYLGTYWIQDQAAYHVKASGRHEKWEKRFRGATIALFTVTLFAALLHVSGVGHHGAGRSALESTLIVVSICVPAVGAAVHGIESQRQFRRHSQRFSRMNMLLRRLCSRMEAARDLPQVQSIAAEVERTMREESNDWFGVMRFHDVELIM